MNAYNAMLHISLSGKEEAVVEHGSKTATYVPDDATVTIRSIDSTDADIEADTKEVKAEKLARRIEKLMIEVDGKKFVDLTKYEKVELKERVTEVMK